MNNPHYFEILKSFFSSCYQNNIQLVTSVITIEEYMVYPYKQNRSDLIDSFEKFLDIMSFEVVNVDKNSAKNAAQIRAMYPAFKGMDSLQLAIAKTSNCDLFITNDKQLRQFTELKCATVDELA